VWLTTFAIGASPRKTSRAGIGVEWMPWLSTRARRSTIDSPVQGRAIARPAPAVELLEICRLENGMRRPCVHAICSIACPQPTAPGGVYLMAFEIGSATAAASSSRSDSTAANRHECQPQSLARAIGANSISSERIRSPIETGDDVVMRRRRAAKCPAERQGFLDRLQRIVDVFDQPSILAALWRSTRLVT